MRPEQLPGHWKAHLDRAAGPARRGGPVMKVSADLRSFVSLHPEVEAIVQHVGLRTCDLMLVDVTFRRETGRRVLRVIVDSPSGLDLDGIAELSERLSRRLDLEGFSPGPYSLEVSSPGIERPLRRPDEYSRQVGRTVKVKTL